MMKIRNAIEIHEDQIADFCNRWQIAEFSLFGSVLRDDFSAESDIDILVFFKPGAPYGIDEHLAMREELESIFGRRVDLVTRRSLKNPFVRQSILSSREVIHAA